jgi:hypothetical protein
MSNHFDAYQTQKDWELVYNTRYTVTFQNRQSFIKNNQPI